MSTEDRELFFGELLRYAYQCAVEAGVDSTQAALLSRRAMSQLSMRIAQERLNDLDPRLIHALTRVIIESEAYGQQDTQSPSMSDSIERHPKSVLEAIKMGLWEYEPPEMEPTSHKMEPISHKEAFPGKQTLSIVVDADIDTDFFATFLAALAECYRELSDGDDLVIREDVIPVGSGVLT